MNWVHDGQTGLVLPWSAKPTTKPGSRESMAQLVADDLKQLLVDMFHDKVGHAMAVAGGKFHWRAAFSKEYGACFEGNRGQCDTIADTLYDSLVKVWQNKYKGESAGQFLDAVHIPRPLSEKEWQEEVDNAWELEIAGSEEGMRKFYEGSARVRKGKDLGGKKSNVGKIG